LDDDDDVHGNFGRHRGWQSRYTVNDVVRRVEEHCPRQQVTGALL